MKRIWNVEIKHLKQEMTFLALNLAILSFLCSSALSQSHIRSYSEVCASLNGFSKRQALGLEALYFGSQGFLDRGQISITPQRFLGFYEYEGMMGGYGISLQTAFLPSLGIGASFGVMEADFTTRTLGLNFQKGVLQKRWATILAQGALAYQRTYNEESEPTAFFIYGDIYPRPPNNTEILVDRFAWDHCFVHAILRANLLFIHPIFDVGLILTRYSYRGFECVTDCFQPGGVKRGSGIIYKPAFGGGISLDFKILRLFSGIKSGPEGGFLLANLVVVF